MVPLPLLDSCLFTFGFSFSVFDGDIFTLVGFEDRSDIRWCEDTDGWMRYENMVSEAHALLSRDPSPHSHSKNGIRSTNPLSPGLPSHGLTMIAFSGCIATCSGLVSMRMTLDRSLFRYERSYRRSKSQRPRPKERSEKLTLTFTILPLT